MLRAKSVVVCPPPCNITISGCGSGPLRGFTFDSACGQFLPQQRKITVVGLEEQIESTAQHRQRIDIKVETSIYRHVPERAFACAKFMRSVNQNANGPKDATSPTPGISPSRASHPNRIGVPGILYRLSSIVENRSTVSISICDVAGYFRVMM